MPRQGSRRGGRRMDRRSSAPRIEQFRELDRPRAEPRAMSARRCSRRSPARRGSCSPARRAHRHPGPGPGLSGAVALGLSTSRPHALTRRGVDGRRRCRGPMPATSPASTSSCRWSPGAITCDYARLARACSTALEARALPMRQPARAAALEQRQGLSRRACATRAFRRSRRLRSKPADDARSRGSAADASTASGW